MEARLLAARERISELEAELARAREQLGEVVKLSELQQADVERYRDAQLDARPNQRERVDLEELQFTLERIIEEAHERSPDSPVTIDAGIAAGADGTAVGGAAPKKKERKARPHGRRRLDLENLPEREVIIDPDEVLAAGGAGFELVDVKISHRLAYQEALHVRLKVVRRVWKRVEAPLVLLSSEAGDSELAHPRPKLPQILTANLPASLWPGYMADPSAIAAYIVSKYDDCLPLHRQERISARRGFMLPRSTVCGWLGGAHEALYRIVEAMFAEARSTAFCIAMDSTSAPVLARGGCKDWHVFVFIADRDHVIFRFAPVQTHEVVSDLLAGYRGHVLADAAPVFDVLYRDGEIIEVACWFHLRRYFWRALETERALALEALALIAKLFTIARDCQRLPMPERTEARANAARPVLALLDEWIARNKSRVDPRGRLDKAIGYYENQRTALHRFLEDGRLRLDNSISEQQLRRVVLGRLNWNFFANREGLRWYTVFRSLIASCALHGLNAQTYLEDVLRLAPHWPAPRVLELAPKYWARTRAGLDERHRAIITPPWELERHLEAARAGPTVDAA